MGRAIVRQPKAFLMDEPLSNLDAKLRVQMRAEIAALQGQLGVTTLYVTHDQVEAMTMGDRVAVMKNGRLMQCAPPQVLYEDPDNVFVAGFIGSPRMNLFQSTLQRDDDGGATSASDRRTSSSTPTSCSDSPDCATTRPDRSPSASGRKASRWPPTPTPNTPSKSTSTSSRCSASETLAYFVAPVESASDADVRDRAQASDEEESILAGAGATVMCARLVPPVSLPDGAHIRLTINTNKLYFFDANGDNLRHNGTT